VLIKHHKLRKKQILIHYALIWQDGAKEPQETPKKHRLKPGKFFPRGRFRKAQARADRGAISKDYYLRVWQATF
jgi:hypothetical protein